MNEPGQQPLVGLIVHLAVVIAAVAGCGLLGWAIAGAIPAALGGLLALALWFGVFADDDLERSPIAIVRIPGRARLALEAALVIAGSIGIWIVWNRAAGETFLTVAALDFAVRYQRIAALFRGEHNED